MLFYHYSAAQYSATGGGGVLKYQAVAGSIAMAGAFAAQAILTQAIEGTLTLAGAVAKKTSKSFSGSLTGAGTLVKKAIKLLSGSITPVGVISRHIIKAVFTGVLAMSGALVAGYKTAIAFAGSIAMSSILGTITGVILPSAYRAKRLYYRMIGRR